MHFRHFLDKIVLLLSLTFLSHACCAQKMKTLGIAEGLSSGFVFDIIQSKEGFMYFGTKSGLNRYDGYEFKYYQQDLSDSTSISGAHVECLVEDSQGLIWILLDQTRINLFDPKSETFLDFGEIKLGSVDQSEIILQMFTDPDDNLWVSTNRSTLYKINVPNHIKEAVDRHNFDIAKFIEYKTSYHESSEKQSQHSFIDLFLDKSNKYYWLATSSGKVYKLHWQSNALSLFHKVEDPKWDREVSIFPTKSGQILAGTGSKCLRIQDDTVSNITVNPLFESCKLVYNPKNDQLIAFKNYPFSRESTIYMLSPNDLTKTVIHDLISIDIDKRVNKVYVDIAGVLWFPSGKHLNYFDPGQLLIEHYLQGKSIFDIIVIDSSNILYFDRGRYYIFNMESKKTASLDSYLENNKLLAYHLYISGKTLYGLRRIKENSQSKRYTKKKLFTYNLENHEFRYPQQPEDLNIVDLLIDQENRLWFASLDKGLGYFKPFDKPSTLIYFQPETHKIKIDKSSHLHLGSDSSIWLGTANGAFQTNSHNFPEEIAQVQEIRNNDSSQIKLSSNKIKSFCNDITHPEKYIWIGTENGLNRLNLQTNEVKAFTKRNSTIPDNVIYAIESDSIGNFWISTNKGISNFSPESSFFRNFDLEDGIQSFEFNTSSSAKMPDGRLVFGGVNGINILKPYSNHRNKNRIPPKLALTKITVNNKLYKSTKENVITLPYNRNNISIDFAVLDFAKSSANRYKYRLGNKQNDSKNDWIELKSENHLQFSSLQPDQYFLHIKGCNSVNVWNEEGIKLSILIKPPWWKSKVAYLFYALGIILGITALYNLQIRREKLKRELHFEQREATRLKELDKIKSDFFSNITHEFRTPLTLILEPIRQILREDIDGKIAHRLQLASRNSQKLLLLVNQLLDISKLEAGKMSRNFSKGDILHVLNPILEFYKPSAVSKGLKLQVHVKTEATILVFDKEHLGKIISNLLSNSLKFTDKGYVKIEVDTLEEENNKFLRLTIIDTGKGIAQNEIDHIFERFYQAGFEEISTKPGTGIGLALVKELVLLHEGQIHVESVLRQGSRFEILIPMNLKATSFSQISNPTTIPEVNLDLDFEYTPIENSTAKELILIIEDNTELRHFIATCLHQHYLIIEAENGLLGLQMALEQIPDLIISDVAMPKMNGYDVLEAVKNDTKTSHIPVILLTAKTAMENRLLGLRSGADCYLTKPFNTEELLLQIHNLIEYRTQIQKRFLVSSSTDEIPSEENLISRLDKDFLDQINNYLEENISNNLVTVESLAAQVFMSRSQLFRKLKALTNQSPNVYIRNLRLERAYEKLQAKKGNVSTIAYEVGFENSKYFSTRFKERFGKSPSEM